MAAESDKRQELSEELSTIAKELRKTGWREEFSTSKSIVYSLSATECEKSVDQSSEVKSDK